MTMADGKTMAVMKKFVIIANPEKILPKKNQMMNKFKMKLNKTKISVLIKPETFQ